MPSTFANAFSGPAGLLIAAALILFFVVRQFTARRVLSVGNVIVPAALLYFAVQSVGGLDPTGWVLLGISLSLAVALGAARGLSFRVWIDRNGHAMMQGAPLTAALWIATIAIKVALTVVEVRLGLSDEGASTQQSLLAGVVTIAAQLLVVYLRAQDERPVTYRMS